MPPLPYAAGLEVTKGETEKFEMPQPWAQTAMLCCVHAVLALVASVLIVPVLIHESEGTTDENNILELSHGRAEGSSPRSCRWPAT